MVTLSKTVLGIDPGARQIGVSIFRDEQILFYAVKTFRRTSREDSLRTLREILKKLTSEYKVDFVAFERVVFLQQHRSFVKIAADEIKDFFKSENIYLSEYNPKQIRQIICGLEKPTNRNAALILIQKHTELVRYFNVPKLWQKRYFALLFGAIAVGIVGSQESRETKGVQ